MAGCNVLDLDPSDVLFSQDSISEDFGGYSGESLEDTFRDLLYGVLDIDDIPPISVVKMGGNYWVESGNRRLYVYKKLNECGRLDSIPVVIKPFLTKKTTKNNGMSVKIRQDKERGYGDKLEDRLDAIVQDWRMN